MSHIYFKYVFPNTNLPLPALNHEENLGMIGIFDLQGTRHHQGWNKTNILADQEAVPILGEVAIRKFSMSEIRLIEDQHHAKMIVQTFSILCPPIA